jgi:hypothetical protein
MQLPAVPLGPALNFPDPFVIPDPVLELPSALIPDYEPLPLYMSPGEAQQLAAPTPKVELEEVEEETKPQPKEKKREETPPPRDYVEKPAPSPPKEVKLPPIPNYPILQPEEDSEVIFVQLPGTEIDIPVPKAEILSAAATTSVISVAATLTATSVFKRLVTLLKPGIQQVVQRIQKLRGKKVKSWARQRLELRRSRLHRMGS